MEGKRHLSAAYEVECQSSRIQQDIDSCSKSFLSSLKMKDSTFLRASISSKAERRPLRVGIIVAGLAGLRCAQVLLPKDCDVTISEGRNRLGGRLHQEPLQGRVVDVGASWIHGTENNPLLQLAKATDVKLAFVGDSTCVYDPHGKQLSQQRIDSAIDSMWDITSNAFRYSNAENATIQPATSLKDFFEQQLASSVADDRELIMSLAEIWGFFIGAPWEKQSLKWFWLEECLDGDNIFVAGSHQAILNKLTSTVEGSATICLSCTVTDVENVGTLENQSPKVIVKGAFGSFEFDEVVVTVPLGCLKRDKPIFKPALPPHIRHAIDNASYGNLEKVYLSFPTEFWNVQNANDQSPTTLPTRPSSESTSFTHFLKPQYVPEEQRSWNIELIPLPSACNRGSKAGCLLFALYGPAASFIASRASALSPKSPEYVTFLAKFFFPYYSLLPNFVADDPNCDPSGALATNWQEDPLAGHGSYTNFQVSESEPANGREVQLDEDIRAMRHGMPERGIWFAGEHTAPFVAVGTTTGAYWSGESAAVRVLSANGLM